MGFKKPILFSELIHAKGKNDIINLITKKDLKIMIRNNKIYFVDVKSSEFHAEEYQQIEYAYESLFKSLLKGIARNSSKSEFRNFVDKLEKKVDNITEVTMAEIMGMMCVLSFGLRVRKPVKERPPKAHIRNYKERKYVPPQSFLNYYEFKKERSRGPE